MLLNARSALALMSGMAEVFAARETDPISHFLPCR